MFGPESGASGWGGLPVVYDRVRTMDHTRTADFLSIWEGERCKMVEMSCELHDKYAANTQFITHLMGRILGKQVCTAVPGICCFQVGFSNFVFFERKKCTWLSFLVSGMAAFERYRQ